MQNAESQESAEASELQQFLNLHYGMILPTHLNNSMPSNLLEAFPKKCAELLTSAVAKHVTPTGNATKALDVGCSVGGASFELAKEYDEVVGLDISPVFIQTANTLKDSGNFVFDEPGEGELKNTALATVDSSIDREKVTFKQCDAMCIPPDLQGFDAVLAGDVLEHLASPSSLLGRMGGPQGLVRKGGVLVLTSPYQWDEHKTPKVSWLGGYESESGEKVISFDGVKDRLGDEFDLIDQHNVPVLMREKERKFSLTITNTTVWKRKED